MANDMEAFDLHRSRIPTSTVFKTIVQDIDLMLLQHGPPLEHETEVARSPFLPPIFNHTTVLVFHGAVRNNPDPIIPSRIASQGRIQSYFKIFGSIAALSIQVKRKKGDTETSRLEAIGQSAPLAIRSTSKQSFVLIYAILCDGEVFEFFQLTGGLKPYSFKCGCYGDKEDGPTRFRLLDSYETKTPYDFIATLRPIYEMISYLLLQGYISALEA